MANISTFSGIGKMSISTTETPFSSQDGTFFPYLTSFSVTKSVSLNKKFGYAPAGGTGLRQQLAILRQEADYTGEIVLPAQSWLDIQLLMGQIASTETVEYREVKSGIVTSGIITDADLNGLTVADVTVTNPFYDATGGTESVLSVVASPATPTANQVELDPVGNTLTFHASKEGLTVYYTILKTSSVSSVGKKASPTLIRGLRLDGVIQTTSGANANNGWRITIPSLELNGDFAISVTGDDEITVPFQPLLTSASNEPIILSPA